MSLEAPRSRTISPGWLCVAIMLTAHLVLGIDAARRLTVTHDEYWHLPAGLAAWNTGRFDADNLNPPLTRMWDALPLLCTSARVDLPQTPGDAFRLGDRFFADNRERYGLYLALARSMNVLLSVATGWLMAVWAAKLFGLNVACLAAALWSFCPTALANAALVTPDVGATFLFAATLFLCWRYSILPTWRAASIVGLLLGLAQLAKFTNLLLYPLCAATWFIIRVRNPDVAPITWRRALGHWIVAAVISVGVLNAGYLFRGSAEPLRTYQFQSRAMTQIADVLRPLDALPVPLPRDYLEGLDRQRQIMEGEHPVYLDGVWNVQGFGDYYLLALAYKLPHAAQALIVVAAIFVLFPARLPRIQRAQCLLWLPVVVVIGVASAIGMQLGVRYVLPAVPFLYIAAAQAARWFDWKRFRFRTVLLMPLIAALPLSLRFHPHHLAYFNELAGGPVGGREHLLDSNLDWGQDLQALADYVKEHEIGEIGLAYFGMMPPAGLGIEYRLPPSWKPEPGWFAVSVNFIYGRPHTIRNPDGSLRSADIREFAYFRDFKPVAHIGYSIDVFHISADDVARWRQR